MAPKEKQRYDAYVSQVRQKIRTKLNLFKFVESDSAKRDKDDVFVIAKLSGAVKTREIEADFEMVSGVENGTEHILSFLKATPKSEVRDFRVISRHSSPNDAEQALETYLGRETELADAVKHDIVRKEALMAQRLAEARARAQYLAQLRARSGNVSVGGRRTSGRRSGRC